MAENKSFVYISSIDFLLLLLPVGFDMPIIAKWIVWFICTLLSTFILYQYNPFFNKVSKELKLTGLVLVSISFWIIVNNIALSQWMEEKALQSSGELTTNWNINNKKAKLEIGSSRITFPSTDSISPLMFDKIDSNVKVKNVNGKVLLTTDVHDKNGELIVNIIDNHWKVSESKSVSWEKNFTNDSLEIKDKRGHIVLQVELLPDRIKIQGEWWDEYGNGVRYVQLHYNSPNRGGVKMIKLTKDDYLKEPHIQPIFKYPSDKYFGKRLNSSDKLLEKIFLYRIFEINN